MFCPNCGTEIVPGAAFCAVCGKANDIAEEHCASCGALLIK